MKNGMKVQFKMCRSNAQTFNGRITADKGCGTRNQIWVYVPEFKHQVCIDRDMITKVMFSAEEN